jgi:hypothetical protein
MRWIFDDLYSDFTHVDVDDNKIHEDDNVYEQCDGLVWWVPL